MALWHHFRHEEQAIAEENHFFKMEAQPKEDNGTACGGCSCWWRVSGWLGGKLGVCGPTEEGVDRFESRSEGE